MTCIDVDNSTNISDFDDVCHEVAVYDRYVIVVNIMVACPLCVIGLMGNCLTMSVLRRDASIKSTVSVLMQALAAADSFYLVTCLGFQTVDTLCYSTDLVPALMLVYPSIQLYVYALASTAQTAAVWLVVVITVERFFAICRPFSVLSNRTTSEVKVVVLLTFVVAFVYSSPRFFEIDAPQCYWNVCRRRFEWMSDHSALRKDRVYRIVYRTGAYFVLRLFGPFTTIVALNGMLIAKMRSHRKLHASLMSTSRLNNDSVTMLLLSMVAVFLICQFPDFIVRLAVLASDTMSVDFDSAYPTVLCNALLTVNSSVNCLVYCVSGPRFRRILRRLICGWIRGDVILTSRSPRTTPSNSRPAVPAIGR